MLAYAPHYSLSSSRRHDATPTHDGRQSVCTAVCFCVFFLRRRSTIIVCVSRLRFVRSIDRSIDFAVPFALSFVFRVLCGVESRATCPPTTGSTQKSVCLCSSAEAFHVSHSAHQNQNRVELEQTRHATRFATREHTKSRIEVSFSPSPAAAAAAEPSAHRTIRRDHGYGCR